MAYRSPGWTAVGVWLATMLAPGVSSLSSAKADDSKAKDEGGSVWEGLELPILHFSVRMKSLAQPSEQEFENALTHTKAHEASAERMAAVLAGEASLLDAEKLSGREKIDFFERAAREGDAAAAAALGDKLDLGDGVSENPGRAFGYFRAGAIGGRMDAAHNLGAAYAKGRGVRRDFTEALAWLIVARARGDTSGAEQQLRDRLIERHREEMVKTAEKHAGEWQRRFSREEIAAALPLPAPFEFGPAAGELTNVEAEDGPVEKLETPATPPVVVMTILGDRLTWPTVDALQRAANRGEPAALGALGRLLAAGKLMPADPLGAVVLLEHSAALGNVDAAHQLGDLYADGEKLLRDDAKSFAYFTQAARGGSLLAMASVGVYYTNGRGVERNLVKGLAWLIVAKHYRVDLGQEGRLRSFLVQHRTDDVAKAESVAAGLIHEIDALAK